MRFDDRLETILQIDPAHAAGRDALWSQLVDLLAQSGPELAPQSARRGLAALALLRSRVSLAARIASARSIAKRCRFAPLATFLGNDDSAVVVALFDDLSLPAAVWGVVLPDIGPLARSRLRRRANLPQPVYRQLASFGATDFALPAMDAAHSGLHAVDAVAPLSPLPSIRPSGSSIADLVQRIEAYRNRPAANDAAVSLRADAELETGHDNEEAARFRTDADGNIRSLSGLPRGVLIGISLAQAARPIDSGVDAGVARAFAKRQAICAGRLLLVGAGPWSGDWLVDATPQFDRETGRFTGYEGGIHHGFAALQAEPDPVEYQPRSDGMRQMVHELRSPLNAISGFAQLIEGQFFGPVSNRYRDLARGIIADATFLSGAFEDIDLAARLDAGRLARGDGRSDAAAMVSTLLESGSFHYDGPMDDVPVLVAEQDLHQILSRYLALVTLSDGAPAASPRISLSSPAMAGYVTIVAQSGAVKRHSEGAAQHESSALGSAFSWRLVERMALNHGGSLQIVDDKALLNLPCARQEEGRFGAGT